MENFDVPGGTVVSSSAWALHFNPIPFPSPEEWRPERWLESDGETLTELRKWIWTFGSDAQVCIGIHFSMRGKSSLLFPISKLSEDVLTMQMKLVIKELLATMNILDKDFPEDVEQEDVFSASPPGHSR